MNHSLKKSIYLSTAQRCYYKNIHNNIVHTIQYLGGWGGGIKTLITTFLPSYIPIFKKFFDHCPVCFWKCGAYVFCLQDANFQWLTNNVWFQKISISAPTPKDFLFQCVFEDPPPPRNFQNFWTGTSYHPQKFKVVLVLQKEESEY